MMNKIIELNENNTILLIIDIQEKLLNATFNKEILEKKSSIIAKGLSLLNVPSIITEQYPKGLGSTLLTIKEPLNSSKVYEKTTFNALADENLLAELNTHNRKEVLLMGIETHICVYQTAISLINKGFNVTLISDACGSRAKEEYDSAIKSMQELGIKIKTTEMILFEILKTAKHEKFKEIQSLIK